MISNIIFDVGGVLVNLYYEPFIRYLQDAGADMSDLSAWVDKVGLEAHERGEVSGEQMLDRIAATTQQTLDRAELRERWLDMFGRAHEMFHLASGLTDSYRVYLLSNIGDLHWEYLDSQFRLESLVHGALASFRVGASKPDAEIYREAERRFQLEPAATVFIDDLLPNVEAARARGWHAIRHSGAEATRTALEALGVRLPPP